MELESEPEWLIPFLVTVKSEISFPFPCIGGSNSPKGKESSPHSLNLPKELRSGIQN